MIDLHYFGNINYYITLSKSENEEFAVHLPYQKGWFNNKCMISTANGPLKLSIPIVGGRNQNALLKDVRIAYDENWRHQHLRAIETSYGNAPFFDFYFLKFENFFQKKYEYLVDLNLSAHELVYDIIKIEKKFRLTQENSKEINVSFSKQEVKSNPTNNNIHLKYEQVFENKIGFIKNLSIIDLIFCTGPQAKQLINNCILT
jgi:hypothetical protein